MISIKIFLCLLFIVNYVTSQTAEEIVWVTEIIRHGARAPILTYKDVEWMKNYKKEELTLQGVRMHYIAGQEIRKRYSNLINGRLGSEEMWVRSSGYNRTLQSAISHLYGMFENFKSNDIAYEKEDARVLPPFNPTPVVDFAFNSALDVPYIPYPIHTTNKDKDTFLKADSGVCNKTWEGHLKGTQLALNRLKDLDSFKKPIQNAIDLLKLNVDPKERENPNFDTAFLMSDFLISDYQNSPNP